MSENMQYMVTIQFSNLTSLPPNSVTLNIIFFNGYRNDYLYAHFINTFHLTILILVYYLGGWNANVF